MVLFNVFCLVPVPGSTFPGTLCYYLLTRILYLQVLQGIVPVLQDTVLYVVCRCLLVRVVYSIQYFLVKDHDGVSVNR